MWETDMHVYQCSVEGCSAGWVLYSLQEFTGSVEDISTELALWRSLLSTCSWCVVSALAPLSCGSRRIIQVDAAHWWWLRRDNPLMIVKHFGCTAIYNKALYKCIIHSFIHHSTSSSTYTTVYIFYIHFFFFFDRKFSDLSQPLVFSI